MLAFVLWNFNVGVENKSVFYLGIIITELKLICENILLIILLLLTIDVKDRCFFHCFLNI